MTNLAFLVAAVGVGSFLWHTLATAWSELAVVAWFFAFQAVNLCCRRRFRRAP
jgi:hypothetical protein